MTGTLLWQTRDVFRRARASGFLAGGLVLTAAAALVCLTARCDPAGGVGLAFGRWPVAGGDGPQAVRTLLTAVAFAVAGVAGLLAALFATAGFLPAFLEPAAASVLLSKPPSRVAMFTGRCVGVVLLVAAQAGVFVLATGLAVGWATGVWVGGYWLAWPLLVAQFLPFFGVSAVVAVCTRSAAAAMLGALLAWLMCVAMNVGRHVLFATAPEGASQSFGGLVEASYRVLPKPVDFGRLLAEATGADPATWALPGLKAAAELPAASPAWAVGTAAAIAAALWALAANEFHRQDY